MPFIVWNDRLSVGVTAMDREHKELIAILNSLYDAIRAGAAHDSMSETLERLDEYTHFHFAHEEALFAQSAYPDAEKHCLEHANTLAWLAEVRRKYDNGTAAGLSLEVVNYLKDWLFDHILGSDQKYTPWLHAEGICR
jgi:hemerythrin